MSPLLTLVANHPETLERLAPWCRALDNLQLAILLQASPWAKRGVRVADVVARLSAVSRLVPVGPVYFQRVSRAMGELVAMRAIETVGKGRAKGYRLRPEGFAALVLNQHLVVADPTFDGSEFELKREIASALTFANAQIADVARSMGALPDQVATFNRAVEAIQVLGHRVATREAIDAAFSVPALIERQIAHVTALASSIEQSVASLEQSPLDPALLKHAMIESALDAVDSFPGVMSALEAVASGHWHMTSLKAAVLRYRTHLRYLEELRLLYAGSTSTAPRRSSSKATRKETDARPRRESKR